MDIDTKWFCKVAYKVSGSYPSRMCLLSAYYYQNIGNKIIPTKKVILPFKYITYYQNLSLLRQWWTFWAFQVWLNVKVICFFIQKLNIDGYVTWNPKCLIAKTSKSIRSSLKNEMYSELKVKFIFNVGWCSTDII